MAKSCSRCGKRKPLSEFHHHGPSRDGHNPACKVCLLAQQRQRNQSEEAQKVRKAYDQSAEGRAVKRSAAKRYRESERAKATMRRYDQQYVKTETGLAIRRATQAKYRGTEKQRAAARRYRTSEKGHANARQRMANRRLLRQQGGSEESLAYVEILRGDPCVYCGARCEHIDHIVPVSRGGPGSFDNLTAACADCNVRKQNKSVLVFLANQLAPRGFG